LEAHGQTAAGYSAQAYSRAFLLYFIFALIALVASCFLTETLKTASD